LVIGKAKDDAIVADARQAVESAKLYLASNPGTSKESLSNEDLHDYFDGGKLDSFSVSIDKGKVTGITFIYDSTNYDATPEELSTEGIELSSLKTSS